MHAPWRPASAGPTRSLAFAVLCLAIVAGTMPAPRAQSGAKTYLLKPWRVFDADAGQLREWVVLVRGERIEAAAPANTVTVPAGAQIIDLPGMTLLPGLIEAHSHLFLHPYNETSWESQVLREPLALR